MICHFLRTKFSLILFVLSLGLVTHCFMITDSFKTLDDQFSIVENEDLRSFKNVGKIFSSSFFGGGSYYRPLVSLSFMAEYHFFGLNPKFYYLTNLIIHLASTVVIFYLMGLFFLGSLMPFFISLFFAIHPIHWEAVSNISGRSILLCGFFYINAFFLFCSYTKNPQKGVYYIFSLICFVLALLSKESAFVLPILICSYLLLVDHRVSRKPEVLLRCVMPYFILVVVYIMTRAIFNITTLFVWRSVPEAMLGFITFLRSVITDLRLFVLPLDLHFDRSRMVFTKFYDSGAIFTLLFFIIFIGVLFRWRSRIQRVQWFFLSWFFIDLLPVSQAFATIGVQPGVIATSEHFLYTSSIGIFVLLVLIGRQFFQKMSGVKYFSKTTISFVVIGVFLFFILTTIQQNIYSSQEISMLKQTLHFDPHNTRIRNSLALSLAKFHQFEEAEKHFRAVLKINPLDARAQIGLGKALCDQGKCFEAIGEYEKVTDTDLSESLRNLLRKNLNLTYEIVVQQYLDRIAQEPQNAQWHYSLGVLYAKTERVEDAMSQFQAAVELDPFHKNALFNLATGFEISAEPNKALNHYEQMISLDGEKDEMDEYALTHVGQIYQSLGDDSKAEGYFKRARDLMIKREREMFSHP